MPIQLAAVPGPEDSSEADEVSSEKTHTLMELCCPLVVRVGH